MHSSAPCHRCSRNSTNGVPGPGPRTDCSRLRLYRRTSDAVSPLNTCPPAAWPTPPSLCRCTCHSGLPKPKFIFVNFCHQHENLNPGFLHADPTSPPPPKEGWGGGSDWGGQGGPANQLAGPPVFLQPLDLYFYSLANFRRGSSQTQTLVGPASSDIFFIFED